MSCAISEQEQIGLPKRTFIFPHCLGLCISVKFVFAVRCELKRSSTSLEVIFILFIGVTAFSGRYFTVLGEFRFSWISLKKPKRKTIYFCAHSISFYYYSSEK
jgi:hypothetical protein